MISFIHSSKQIVTLENRQFPDNLMVHGLGSDNGQGDWRTNEEEWNDGEL